MYRFLIGLGLSVAVFHGTLLGQQFTIPYLSYTGMPVSGNTITVQVHGKPGGQAFWAVSFDPRPNSQPVVLPGFTGAFHLRWPFAIVPLGTIPSRGEARMKITLPANLTASVLFPTQALVDNRFSNLNVVRVEPRLVLVSFNQHLLPGVLMNSPFVFTFNTDIRPDSVNSKTIQIWHTNSGKRADAAGVFSVKGRSVTWLPQMTSKVYPTPRNPNPPPLFPIMPADSGLNTLPMREIQYMVFIPGKPNPITVKSLAGQPLCVDFNSVFETIQGPRVVNPGNSSSMIHIFYTRAPYFRDSIRVADILSYSGAGTPPNGYLAWLGNPGSTNGENPLFMFPSFLNRAEYDWIFRDRTGAYVDQTAGIQLLPRQTAANLANNAFPPGVPHTDERFVSNLVGTQKGRGVPVNAIKLFFTQPIAGDSFLDSNNIPKPYSQSPFTIKILPSASTNPGSIGAAPFTMSFRNDTGSQTAEVQIIPSNPVKQGWIWMSIRNKDIKGMPGGNLEGNVTNQGDFVFIWPVRINA